MKVLILSVECVNPDADHPSHCLLSLDAATCDLLSHVIEAGAGAFVATKPVRAAGGSMHCLEVMLPDGVCEWCDIDGDPVDNSAVEREELNFSADPDDWGIELTSVRTMPGPVKDGPWVLEFIGLLEGTDYECRATVEERAWRGFVEEGMVTT